MDRSVWNSILQQIGVDASEWETTLCQNGTVIERPSQHVLSMFIDEESRRAMGPILLIERKGNPDTDSPNRNELILLPNPPWLLNRQIYVTNHGDFEPAAAPPAPPREDRLPVAPPVN